MSRVFDDLDSRMRPLAIELVARCAEIGIPVMIISTIRTPAEQAEKMAQGVSWTMNSKHLPQPPEWKSLAIDVCPYSLFQLHGDDKLQWSAFDPAWEKIGEIGKKLGLKWGVWRSHPKTNVLENIDPGHFEYVIPSAPMPTAA